MRARLALLGALWLVACSDPTELMLVVKGVSPLTSGAGADVDTLRVSVQPADEQPSVFFYVRSVDLCPPEAQGTPSCRPQRFADAEYDGQLTLPVRFLFQPGGDGAGKPVRVWIDALKAGYAKPRLANGVIFRFVEGRRLWLEVPLYRQCLDYLDCQRADQVCGVDRMCTSVTPGDTGPGEEPDLAVADLAGAGDDLPPAPDLAGACGAIGLACCNGTCPTSGACDPKFGLCQDPAVTCGQLGQACCNASTACSTGSCVNMVCTPSCGDDEQACCATAPACFRSGSQCFPSDPGGGAGICHACGATGQKCCPGSVCGGRNTCGTTGCAACGAAGHPPCATGAACDGDLVVDGSGLCKACGGAAGAGCCAGPTCNSVNALTCDKNVSTVTNPQGICKACGQAGEYCCSDSGASPCTLGLTCNGSTCEACGSAGQACCSGSACNAPDLACSAGVCRACLMGSGGVCTTASEPYGAGSAARP